MSYEPTIIALKKDFDKHRELIVNGEWQYGGKEYKKDQKTKTSLYSLTVMEVIKLAYVGFTSVGKTGIVIMTPELTSFNQKVRAKLDELDIEYGLHN